MCGLFYVFLCVLFDMFIVLDLLQVKLKISAVCDMMLYAYFVCFT